MATGVRGDGDQIVNHIYKSSLDSENMAMSNAYLHTPGYLYADITINSPGSNQLTIDSLSAIIEPTNPRNTGELVRVHTTSSFQYPVGGGTVTSGVDDYLVMNLTNVPGDDTVSATITSTTGAGIAATDVVICGLKYTGVWTANTNYVIGDTVTAVAPDGITQYRCTRAGLSNVVNQEPNWDTTFGNTTYSGDITGATVPIWVASTPYSVGDEVIDTAGTEGVRFICTTAGTSGAGEPVWDNTLTNTTTDGASLVWTAEAFSSIQWTAEAVTDLATLNYNDDLVTKSMSKPNIYKNLTYSRDLPGDEIDPNTLMKQFGSMTVTAATTISVIFPREFPSALYSVMCTPKLAADVNWRISADSTTGFTVTFSGPSTGTLYWEATGI